MRSILCANNDTKGFIQKAETDLKISKTKLIVTKWKMWGGMDWMFGIGMYMLLYRELIGYKDYNIAWGNLVNIL